MECVSITYSIKNLNVLVIEQKTLVLKLLTDAFDEFGMPTVQSASDIESAWKYFLENPYDIILSDWGHGLDGLEILRKIRQSPDSPDPSIPIIFVSANTQQRQVCEARDMGTTEFLAKPPSSLLLYRRILSVLEQDRAFIRTAEYTGPDRRRQQIKFTHKDRRKSSAGR